MDPITFVKTIYLGDRACKKIILDGWNDQVAIQVNSISRIRDPSGSWNFYTDEDIENGLIVLSQAKFFSMEPVGLIPNDYIEVEVELLLEESSDENPLYLFKFYIGQGSQDPAIYQTVTVTVKASSIHLEDPALPGTRITY